LHKLPVQAGVTGLSEMSSATSTRSCIEPIGCTVGSSSWLGLLGPGAQGRGSMRGKSAAWYSIPPGCGLRLLAGDRALKIAKCGNFCQQQAGRMCVLSRTWSMQPHCTVHCTPSTRHFLPLSFKRDHFPHFLVHCLLLFLALALPFVRSHRIALRARSERQRAHSQQWCAST